MIRVAAVGDLHVGPEAAGKLAPLFAGLREEADLLLLAGDLTEDGQPAAAETLVAELREVGVPVVAVLGNHDYEAEQVPAVRQILQDGGIQLLDRRGIVLEIAGHTVAIAGTKGFGGGFESALANAGGEPEMRAWIGHAEEEAEALERALSGLDGDIRLVLLHYAPIIGTLNGERLELYPFAGNSMLGAAIDRAGADLVLHGHAHRGSPAGTTPGGIPVRNVSRPVIREPYALFSIEHADDAARQGGPAERKARREGRRPRWLRRRFRQEPAPPATDDTPANA